MADLTKFGFDVGKGRYYEEINYTIALIYNTLNNEVSSYLKDFNMSVAKFNALLVIKHNGGKEGISQVDISKRLIVTPSNMTRLLDRIEKEKLIRRVSRAGDRRVRVVQITEKGSEVLDKAWPGYVETLKKVIGNLNTEDQKALSGLLTKWFFKLVER